MKKLPSILFVIFITINFGCESETETTGNVTIQNLFPMKVGNSWTLASTEYDNTGSINGYDTITLKLDSAGAIAGRSGFYLTSPDGDIIFLYYSGKDLISFNVDRDRSAIGLHFPMNVGEEFTLEDTLRENGYRSKEILRFASTRVPVMVPAGSFDAYHFEQLSMYGPDGDLDTTWLFDMFLAPNVGIVYQRNYSMPERQLRSKQELISYIVK